MANLQSLLIVCFRNNIICLVTGRYCIFKKDYCPTGFTTGWIYWDDDAPWFGPTIQNLSGNYYACVIYLVSYDTLHNIIWLQYK